MIRIEQIYKFNKDNNRKMLGSFGADFWQPYIENFAYFDRLFYNSYRSFVPMAAQYSTDPEDAAVDFTFDVTAWLVFNEKRYAELFRAQVLADEDYPITYNYDLTETYEGTHTEGQRIDSETGTENYGQKTTSMQHNETIGGHTDTHQQDNEYGATSETTGQTIGAQQNTNENKVSAFNESTYQPKDYNDQNLGSRTDSGSRNTTSHKDDLDTTDVYGSQINTGSDSEQVSAHSDSMQKGYTKGAQSDTDGHTLTRKGNIGVQTGSQILSLHIDLWKAYSFYKIIFDDIANEFLRIIY